MLKTNFLDQEKDRNVMSQNDIQIFSSKYNASKNNKYGSYTQQKYNSWNLVFKRMKVLTSSCGTAEHHLLFNQMQSSWVTIFL
jgi:hypothetical protein